mmetsp:Transcript_885/g.1205  ORF Transcript_885/g.1205 Transcript_885/m.1205 type:complete len:188 (-) Transcript_885:88-651(-)|eukprot:CAMPEP_0185580830 /NCGR_PEP_ID=MMETSP0434-20130131/17928_1 /TAXON_ID=626734 ORGANISM="Favella taraikaensis, Strain Fe Narragansett Bay" /NCGR_SAMPLE_ID=MMETSP0434 /ASSEMBLY_ACC=CAM_ASM_000379 /LENGTH=187 /DNA_ID=CAMNT_0028199209 /DNA_START=208 /DNA_END=771 /DNA_ORIENTATION=-
MPQTLREQLAHALSLKEEGNFYFKQKDYTNAIKKYSRVRAFLKPMVPTADQDNDQFVSMIAGKGSESQLTKDEQKQATTVMAATFLNMSICYFLTEQYKRSADRASESIGYQKTIKAHYRRAKALAAIKDYWGACKDLKEALKMDKSDPNNFKHELAQFEALAKQKDKKSDSKLRGFLNKTQEVDQE